MWMYFILFISLVLGTFIGMFATLALFATGKPKQNRKKTNKLSSSIKASNVPEDLEVLEEPLTRKIPSKDFSVTDFVCDADKVKSDEHINTRQQTQDNAYNTLKRHKNRY